MSMLALAILAASLTYLVFSRDLRATRSRLTAESQVIQTRHGLLEYTAFGNGPPVLVVHGAGGGYDQGVLLVRAYGGEGFRWIVPSRFGYLRTSLPADASTAAQADAFADLLDILGVGRVAILAMSGGAPPSLQFALRHPERTSALALLSSAPYAPIGAADQKLPIPIWIYQALFSSNFPYWLLQRIARARMETIFDVTPELRAALNPEERAMVSGMVDSFQPVTWRMKGLQNEGAAIDPRSSIGVEAINAPTLVVHAVDDHINPYRVGEYTAAHVPNAQFLPLTTGGHLLLGHHAEVRTRVNSFLRQYAGVNP